MHILCRQTCINLYMYVCVCIVYVCMDVHMYRGKNPDLMM